MLNAFDVSALRGHRRATLNVHIVEVERSVSVVLWLHINLQNVALREIVLVCDLMRRVVCQELAPNDGCHSCTVLVVVVVEDQRPIRFV